jgi:hypothetical protein
MASSTFEIKDEKSVTVSCDSKGPEINVSLYRWKLEGYRESDKIYMTVRD